MMRTEYRIGYGKLKKFNESVKEFFGTKPASGIFEFDSFIIFAFGDRIKFGFLSHHPKYHHIPYETDYGWVSREEFFEWLPENLKDFFVFNLDLLMEE